jgi:hypothetical protein
MPVDHIYDPSQNIVYAHPHGILTVPEIRGFFEALGQDETLVVDAIEVVHFARVEEFLFGTDEAAGIIGALGRLRAATGLRATIFLGRNDFHIGISRMLQTLYELDDPTYPVFVVRNNEDLRERLRVLGGSAVG